MRKYVGLFIKENRLEQNLSQEGLCKGICVVSYLSKIENGLVTPADDIIVALLKQMNLEYIKDEIQTRDYQNQLEEYWDHTFHGEDTKEVTKKINENGSDMLRSDCGLLYRIFRLFYAFKQKHITMLELKDQTEHLKGYESYFTKEHRFLLAIIQGCNTEYSLIERENQFRYAYQLYPKSIVMLYLVNAYLETGDYIDAIQTGERTYSLAAEEGNIYVMLQSSFILGMCYSLREVNDMMRHFKRTLELARNYDSEIKYQVYYDIGATLVGDKKYEQSLEFLEKVLESEKESKNIFLYHKLSIAYCELGDSKKAEHFLEIGEGLIDSKTKPVIVDIMRLARMRLRKDYKEKKEYEELLISIYKSADTLLGFGFKVFHGQFLIDLYESQRKYKEALFITREISYTNVSRLDPTKSF